VGLNADAVRSDDRDYRSAELSEGSGSDSVFLPPRTRPTSLGTLIRQTLEILLAVTLAAGLAFIVIIEGSLGSGVEVHEIAGIVLLFFLVLALWAASRLRSIDRRPMTRVVIGLIALVAAGVTGAGLALGAIPSALAGLPLLPLIVTLVVVADGLRITHQLPRSVTLPSEAPSPAGRA
jgi:peptidoglycan/LPS O-acetylase OafA/YrhL